MDRIKQHQIVASEGTSQIAEIGNDNGAEKGIDKNEGIIWNFEKWNVERKKGIEIARSETVSDLIGERDLGLSLGFGFGVFFVFLAFYFCLYFLALLCNVFIIWEDESRWWEFELIWVPCWKLPKRTWVRAISLQTFSHAKLFQNERKCFIIILIANLIWLFNLSLGFFFNDSYILGKLNPLGNMFSFIFIFLFRYSKLISDDNLSIYYYLQCWLTRKYIQSINYKI